jgi:hypothetical protein
MLVVLPIALYTMQPLQLQGTTQQQQVQAAAQAATAGASSTHERQTAGACSVSAATIQPQDLTIGSVQLQTSPAPQVVIYS